MLVRFNRRTIVEGTIYSPESGDVEINNDIAERIVAQGFGIIVGIGETSDKVNTGYGVSDAAVKKLLKDAKNEAQFVDLCLISDSNGAFGGNGWNVGILGGSYDSGFPLYSTPIISAKEASPSYGTGSYQYITGVANTDGASTGAPAFCGDEFMGLTDHAYMYLSAGSLTARSYLIVPKTFPGGIAHNWNFRLYYAQFAASGAAFGIRCRLEESPFTTLASNTGLTSVGASDGLTYVDLPVDATAQTLNLGFGAASGSALQYFSYMLGWKTDVTGGLALNDFGLYGGEKLTDFTGTRLPSQTDAQIRGFLQVIRDKHLALYQQPRIIILVNMGMNDRSVNSKAVYKAALVSLMTRFRDAYLSIGGVSEELYFLLMPSHRIEDNEATDNQAALTSYSAAADEIAMAWSNTASINLNTIFTAAEADANGWYDGASNYHLLAPGNIALWRRGLSRVFGL